MNMHAIARSLATTTLCGLLTALPLQSKALNILVANDDGLTANIKALSTALNNAGHDVLISVPCQNQSGKGAAVNFLTPITPLTTACRGKAAPAGAPGVGPIDKTIGLANAYYVNGTPVMALLYGLDVLAPQRWGKTADLVISGPNEGQNLGSIVVTSGTVSNAQYAISRGLPALAVSADINTTDNPALAAETAALTLRVVDKLVRHPGKHGLLPKGFALNVNFPKFDTKGSYTLPWSITRFGNFDSFQVQFVNKLGDDPIAKQMVPPDYLNYPGITVVTKTAAHAASDTDPQSEALENMKGKITLTPMQLGFEVAPAAGASFDQYLQATFKN